MKLEKRIVKKASPKNSRSPIGLKKRRNQNLRRPYVESVPSSQKIFEFSRPLQLLKILSEVFSKSQVFKKTKDTAVFI